MDRPGVRQLPEGSGEQKKMERKKNGSEVICSAPTILAVRDRREEVSGGIEAPNSRFEITLLSHPRICTRGILTYITIT